MFFIHVFKMSFKPDPSEQAQEVIFSRKIKKPNHPELISSRVNSAITDWILKQLVIIYSIAPILILKGLPS